MLHFGLQINFLQVTSHRLGNRERHPESTVGLTFAEGTMWETEKELTNRRVHSVESPPNVHCCFTAGYLAWWSRRSQGICIVRISLLPLSNQSNTTIARDLSARAALRHPARDFPQEFYCRNSRHEISQVYPHLFGFSFKLCGSMRKSLEPGTLPASFAGLTPSVPQRNHQSCRPA